PEYIHRRIERLGQAYSHHILLLSCHHHCRGLDSHQRRNRIPTLQPSQTLAYACKENEVIQYLAAFKQSEHRSLTLICEHLFKTPGAVLRTAFTNISRLNGTSFETLHASLLRRTPLHFTDLQSLRLPRFGLKKVTGLKDTFKRPFRTGTT
ncbi:hypothetical protein EDB84DRAFT_1251888, partial [Lactarius hengduanensis]